MKTLSKTQQVKEVKRIIDLYINIDVQSCYPDHWNEDNYNDFCSFVERQKVSEKTIRENWIPDTEMDSMFGEWNIVNMACEIYDRVMWERIYTHNKKCLDIKKTIWYPDSASICPYVREYETLEEQTERLIKQENERRRIERENEIKFKGMNGESILREFFKSEQHPAPSQALAAKQASGKTWNELRSIYKN